LCRRRHAAQLNIAADPAFVTGASPLARLKRKPRDIDHGQSLRAKIG
jgi:hypothetical protein